MVPQKLCKGDTIGVFSPSSPASFTAPTRYKRGKDYLKGKGYKVLEGSLTGKRDFYRSGTILERAEELNALIRNPEVRCIMSTIGGMNSNSLLPYIDYESLMKDPKIIIGYSDVTALLLGIYKKTGITTYYGPALVASFGELPPFVDDTFAYFESIVSDKSLFPFTLETPEFWTDEFLPWEDQARSKTGIENKLITLQQGKAEGKLIGGNLNTIGGIWGTEYMPEIDSETILLIEDSLKNAAAVERSFAHLKAAGVLDKICGLILGKHEKFDDQGCGRKPYEILSEIMGNVEFPVLCEFDCCHTHPMLTIPIGSHVILDADKQQLTIVCEEYEEMKTISPRI